MADILAPLIIAVPLAGFLAISLLRPTRRLAGLGATAAVGLAFALSLAGAALLVAAPEAGRAARPLLWTWWQSGGLVAEVRLLYDPLSAFMACVVTGVATLVHVYSVGYMAGDRGYRRYFALLNLFVGAMLLLVLAGNYLLLLVGWAGVGLSSYLLIGHWRERAGVPQAATKAFVINTLGDIGLMFALFVMATRVGSVDYGEVFSSAPRLAPGTVTLISLGLLLAAAAKSAQLPLQVWLPAAMAGPTPVSALIHAATMVTAGVYLLARSATLISLSPLAPELIAGVGAFTALVGALAAAGQTNIKRVLAYSTVSQLGYMFLGVGVGAYGAGMAHLWTHALYKACLFLAAGAVIHALHGEEDLGRMGGLRSRLPVIWLSALAGAAALAGLPPFSGFWSKDEVLAAAFFAPGGHPLFGALALVTSGLTGYYAARLVLLAFHGPRRGEAGAHPPGALLTLPVAALGALSLLGGAALWGGALPHFLEPAWLPVGSYEPPKGAAYWGVSAAAAGLALGGGLLAWALHARGWLAGEPSGAGRLLLEGLGFDRAYGALVLRPARALGGWLSGAFERGVVDRTVWGAARAARGSGMGLSALQGGYVRGYASAALAGTVGLLLYVLWRLL